MKKGLKEAHKTSKTLGLLTTVAEIVEKVEMNEILYSTVEHLKALGFQVEDQRSG